MIRTAFEIALLTVVGVLVLLAAAIAVRQALHQSAERRQARTDAVIRPVLFDVLDTGALPDNVELEPSQRRALNHLAVAMLTKVRGDDRTVLIDLLDDGGVLDTAQRGLESRRAIVRARSAELLGSARITAAVIPITKLLADPRHDVRIVAARALGKLGDPTAAAPLLASVDGPDRLPQGLVAMSLVRLGEPGAPGLRSGLTNESRRMRSLAAEVLGQVGDLGAVDALIGVLTSDPDTGVRVQAAGALGRLGMPRAVESLVTCLQSDAMPELRAQAARSLGLIGSPAAADAAAATVDESQSVARSASAALAAVAPERLTLLGEQDSAKYAREALALETLAASRRGIGRRGGSVAA